MKKFICMVIPMFILINSKAQITLKSVSLGLAGNATHYLNLSKGYEDKLFSGTSYSNFTPDSGYSYNSNYYNFGYNTSSTSEKFMANLGIGKDRNSPHEIRLGFSNSSFQISNFKNYQMITYDTLISNQTGNVLYTQNRYNQEIGYSINSSHLQLDVAYIYKYKTNRKFNFYSGFGFKKSFFLNQNSNIMSMKNNYFTGLDYRYNNYYYTSERIDLEKIKINNFQIYAPIGLEYKLSKRNGFWSHLSLFGDVCPALSFTKIENKTNTSTNVSGNLGLKINFKK